MAASVKDGVASMHRRIVNPVLESLDKERAGYFSDVVARIEEDPRTERFANFVYLLLKETMPVLPVYLDKAEFVELVFDFVNSHYGAMKRRVFDRRFVLRPESLKEVTDEFVNRVVDRTMARYEEGDLDTGERSHQKFTWPYRAEDLVDPDDEEAMEALKHRPAYTGPERRKRRD
jgi:hypothetical protein